MSLFLQPKISYEQLCTKLHEIIENEYALEYIFSSTTADANWRTQAHKLLTLWGNICPGDMLSAVARTKIVSEYVNDREFQERWYSIGVRMAAWIESSSDIAIADLSEFIQVQLRLPIQSESTIDTLPPQLLAPRVEATGLDTKWLSSSEMFWYVCLILARMTLEHSKLVTWFVNQAQLPATKTPVRREPKLRVTDQNN